MVGTVFGTEAEHIAVNDTCDWSKVCERYADDDVAGGLGFSHGCIYFFGKLYALGEVVFIFQLPATMFFLIV